VTLFCQHKHIYRTTELSQIRIFSEREFSFDKLNMAIAIFCSSKFETLSIQ